MIYRWADPPPRHSCNPVEFSVCSGNRKFSHRLTLRRSPVLCCRSSSSTIEICPSFRFFLCSLNHSALFIGLRWPLQVRDTRKHDGNRADSRPDAKKLLRLGRPSREAVSNTMTRLLSPRPARTVQCMSKSPASHPALQR